MGTAVTGGFLFEKLHNDKSRPAQQNNCMN